jgi:PilZ domain-containing protein
MELTKMNIVNELVGIILPMSKDEQKQLIDELLQSTGNERRSHLRKPYIMDVSYISRDYTNAGVIKDISDTGVLVDATGNKERVDTGDDVLLTVPDSVHKKNYKLRGKVVRLLKNGFAVELQNEFIPQGL